MTLYELAVLVARGRVNFTISLESLLQDVETKFVIKPITRQIAARATTFPKTYPKDPMDRLIGATALVEGLRLVTADEINHHVKGPGVGRERYSGQAAAPIVHDLIVP